MHNIPQETIQSEAASAVQEDSDIQAKVRDITLRALSRRSLSVNEIGAVVRDVTTGVTQGLENRVGEVNRAAREALAGMDDAIKKTAEATKLAAEQLLSQGKEFNAQDLTPAIEDLKQLEAAFFSTVSKVTGAAGDRVKTEFTSQLAHLQRTGSDSGKLIAETIAEFNRRATPAAKAGIKQGMQAASEVKQRLTLLASGILAGMADSLQEKVRRDDQQKVR